MSLKQLFPMHLFFMANPTEVLRLCCVVIGVVTIHKKFERFFAHPLLLYSKNGLSLDYISKNETNFGL